MNPYLVAFILGLIVGSTVAVIGMALLIATRDEYRRYHPW